MFFSFSLLSLNAKQINPPPSAESFPLVLSVSLILCSWKLHYSDRSKSLLCGSYKRPPWLLETASSAPRSEPPTPLSDAPLSQPRTSGPELRGPGSGGKASAAPSPPWHSAPLRAGEPWPRRSGEAAAPARPCSARSSPGRGVRSHKRYIRAAAGLLPGDLLRQTRCI